MEGTRAAETPVYFEKLGILLADLMISDTLNSRSLSTITNKLVYQEFMSEHPSPKIVRESRKDYRKVWERLHSSFVDSKAKDILLLLIHNKLQVPERLFHIKLKPDPYCEFCDEAVVSDVVHFFCSCRETTSLWSWLRNKLLSFSHCLICDSDWDIINLFFAQTKHEK